MPKSREYNAILARESALVDAQSLLQKALNETYGNPRDDETLSVAKTKALFKAQRIYLANKLGKPLTHVNRLFADNAKLNIKDLAEALHVLGYELTLTSVKKES